ncbi:MAG: MBL fold metallo-hydrolase [Alphaproteobacteria bacterium]|nr:MBL fold metallo-hydrolase [Alphaproteobacteria bacterium]
MPGTAPSTDANTRIDEIASGIFRISTPVPPGAVPGGFTFNQFLVVDEEPLLFHTGLRGIFPAVVAAISKVMPITRLRYVAFSHFEADECGALNQFLAAAPGAVPVCSAIGAMTSIGDLADQPPRAMADGEVLNLGGRRVTWFDTPHVPHGWDCGMMMETTTRTLLCGDLFTQGGDVHKPLTTGDILEPSEQMRAGLDYYAHGPATRTHLERLAQARPAVLACMHGSSYEGDGAALLRALAARLERPAIAA